MLNNNWQSIHFKNSSGLKLAGLFHEPPKLKDGSKPVIIVCHGFLGGKEGGGMALAMGEELGERGYGVLLFDFTGVGESEGDFAQSTLSDQIDDLKCAVDWCASAAWGPIIVTGRSFGGTTAICHSAHDPRVKAVCTWSAPARLKELFGKYAAPDGLDGVYKSEAFFIDRDKYDVPALAGRIAPRPLLIIHGERDEVVAPSDAGLIYENAGRPKELVYIPNADHRYVGCHRKVWDKFFAWLEEAIVY